MAKSKLYYPHLDALRTIAFLSVFLFHTYYAVPANMTDSAVYQFIHFVFNNGHLAVNFFFVLSGFLITSLLLQEEGNYGKIHLGSFYMRRILRIWPLYYLTFVFGYFIFPWLVSLAGAALVETANPWLYVFFLGNINSLLNGDPASGTLSVLWSIAVEEQFYLVWPLLLMICNKHRPALFLTVITGSLLFRIYYVDNTNILFYHTFSALSDLAFGGWIGWWAFTKQMQENSLIRLNSWLILGIYLAGFTIIICRDIIFVHPALLVVERIVFAMFFGFILLEQSFARNSIVKASQFASLTTLGKYTYGLYCLHIPAMVFTTGIAMLLQQHENYWWVLIMHPIATLILSIAFSKLAYYGIEKHFLKLKDKFQPSLSKTVLSHNKINVTT